MVPRCFICWSRIDGAKALICWSRTDGAKVLYMLEQD